MVFFFPAQSQNNKENPDSLRRITTIKKNSFKQNLKAHPYPGDSIKPAKNSIFFELGGNGGLYSVNYDRLIFSKKNFKISGRIGGSIMPYEIKNPRLYVFSYPIEINFFYGKKSNIEIGIGCTPVFLQYSLDILKTYYIYANPIIRLGYRYQKPNGGYYFRAGMLIYSVVYSFPGYYADWYTDRLWLGLSFGYTFKIIKK